MHHLAFFSVNLFFCLLIYNHTLVFIVFCRAALEHKVGKKKKKILPVKCDAKAVCVLVINLEIDNIRKCQTKKQYIFATKKLKQTEQEV